MRTCCRRMSTARSPTSSARSWRRGSRSRRRRARCSPRSKPPATPCAALPMRDAPPEFWARILDGTGLDCRRRRFADAPAPVDFARVATRVAAAALGRGGRRRGGRGRHRRRRARAGSEAGGSAGCVVHRRARRPQLARFRRRELARAGRPAGGLPPMTHGSRRARVVGAGAGRASSCSRSAWLRCPTRVPPTTPWPRSSARGTATVREDFSGIVQIEWLERRRLAGRARPRHRRGRHGAGGRRHPQGRKPRRRSLGRRRERLASGVDAAGRPVTSRRRASTGSSRWRRVRWSPAARRAS